jgi:hypothetical protein
MRPAAHSLAVWPAAPPSLGSPRPPSDELPSGDQGQKPGAPAGACRALVARRSIESAIARRGRAAGPASRRPVWHGRRVMQACRFCRKHLRRLLGWLTSESILPIGCHVRGSQLSVIDRCMRAAVLASVSALLFVCAAWQTMTAAKRSADACCLAAAASSQAPSGAAWVPGCFCLLIRNTDARYYHRATQAAAATPPTFAPRLSLPAVPHWHSDIVAISSATTINNIIITSSASSERQQSSQNNSSATSEARWSSTAFWL